MQKLQPNYKPRWKEFTSGTSIIDGNGFLDRVAFSDETILSDKLRRHNSRIKGEEKTCNGIWNDSLKINVWCALTCHFVMRPLLKAQTYELISRHTRKLLNPLNTRRILLSARIHTTPSKFEATSRYSSQTMDRKNRTHWMTSKVTKINPYRHILFGVYEKTLVYRTQVQNLPDFRRQTMVDSVSVTPKMPHNTWNTVLTSFGTPEAYMWDDEFS